jgi:hypothetical protein
MRNHMQRLIIFTTVAASAVVLARFYDAAPAAPSTKGASADRPPMAGRDPDERETTARSPPSPAPLQSCPSSVQQYQIEVVLETIEPERTEKRVIPAVYKTMTVPVTVREAYTQYYYARDFFGGLHVVQEEQVPAEVRYEKRRKLIQPERVETITIPARQRQVTRLTPVPPPPCPAPASAK